MMSQVLVGFPEFKCFEPCCIPVEMYSLVFVEEFVKELLFSRVFEVS